MQPSRTSALSDHDEEDCVTGQAHFKRIYACHETQRIQNREVVRVTFSYFADWNYSKKGFRYHKEARQRHQPNRQRREFRHVQSNHPRPLLPRHLPSCGVLREAMQ